jgi:4-hydroxy-tetrahydrodipicolinate reductase
MRIALIGYGKMGKMIEQIAISRHHTISYKIIQSNWADISKLNPENTDIAIEFTQPESAYKNIAACLAQKIPVVCGTTGWLHRKDEIEAICLAQNSAFLHASNFSIGVNIFFKVNQLLAKLMNGQKQYQVAIEEIHHTEKKDSPSGTAIVIAEHIIHDLNRKTSWVLADDNKTKQFADSELPITALRLPEVPGTHTVTYESAQDRIAFTHEAHSREGFALGAVVAAEWLQNKKGNFTIENVIEEFMGK